MKILITGGSGFIGQALARQLVESGHEVTIVDRNPPKRVQDGVRLVLMDLLEDDIREDVLADQDAVIHLMGVSIFHRWTKKYKKALYDSRVATGKKVVDGMMRLSGHHRPKIFVSASAVGIYGNSGKKAVTEDTEPGTDFLARLCQDWEGITAPFKNSNVRTVAIRTGVVIGPGGMLGTLKPFFKSYIGAVVGSGSQLVSWIALPDLLNIYQRAVEDDVWNGPVNAVAPKPITMDVLTKKFAALLKRPRALKVPSIVLKPVFGSLSSVVLFSQSVVPEKLKSYKYSYVDPDIDSALADALPAR